MGKIFKLVGTVLLLILLLTVLTIPVGFMIDIFGIFLGGCLCLLVGFAVLAFILAMWR